MAFNFNGHTPKEIKYNSNNVFRLIYNGVVVWLQKFLATITGNTPITLEKASEDTINELNVYGDCQYTYDYNLPAGYSPIDAVKNTSSQARLMTGIVDDVDDMEFELRAKPSSGSWYIFQSRETKDGNNICGISGSTSSSTITFNCKSSSITSSISRNTGHIYYIKATHKNGESTLYVKDETTGQEDLKTGTYTYSAATKEIGLWYNGYNNAQSLNSIYMARLKKSGVLVMDYTPAIYNNAIGFYDRVSETFKAPTGDVESVTTAITAPTITNPMNIACNNGVLKVRGNNLEIYTDGPVEKVEVNMFNKNSSNIAMNKIISAEGVVGDSPVNFYGKEYMAVKPNTQYIATGRKADNTISAYTRIFWYDSSKQFISRGAYRKNTATVNTSPSNAAFARICAAPYDVNGITITLQQVQEFHWIFKEGNSESANIATCENLLGVYTYKDSQEILTGAITRNVGIKVLDGTENWELHNNSAYTYRLDNVFSDLAQGVPITEEGYSTHFDTTTQGSTANFNSGEYRFSSTTVDNVMVTSGSRLYMCFGVQYDTVAKVKAYLASQLANGTPVIVIYPLSTSTTDTATAQTLTAEEGTNYVESSLGSREAQVTYYKTN